MQSAFFKSICQVGIFLVCAQTITHFRPNRSYEKYMKLLVSVMVLIQILQPLSSLISGKDLEERVLQFQGQFDEGMSDAMKNISQSEKILENMTLREVRELLEEREEEKDAKVLQEGNTENEAGEVDFQAEIRGEAESKKAEIEGAKTKAGAGENVKSGIEAGAESEGAEAKTEAEADAVNTKEETKITAGIEKVEKIKIGLE